MISFSVQIDENVSVKSAAVQGGIARGVHRNVMAKAAAEEVKDHFTRLDRRRHRGGSFHFYGRASRATSYGVQGSRAFVSIDQEGIGLRRFGGTVRPRTAKYLTIPAIDEAQGKRAGEFSDLNFIPHKGGGRLEDPQGRVFFWLVKQTVHKPDQSVLPTDATISDVATDALKEWVELTEERANG